MSWREYRMCMVLSGLSVLSVLEAPVCPYLSVGWGREKSSDGGDDGSLHGAHHDGIAWEGWEGEGGVRG